MHSSTSPRYSKSGAFSFRKAFKARFRLFGKTGYTRKFVLLLTSMLQFPTCNLALSSADIDPFPPNDNRGPRRQYSHRLPHLSDSRADTRSRVRHPHLASVRADGYDPHRLVLLASFFLGHATFPRSSRW